MKSTTARRARRICLVLALLLSALTAGLASTGSQLARADVSAPSWWSGNCDVGNNAGSYALGASFDGVKACGPRPNFTTQADHLVHFFSGAVGEYEWECAELVMRYMYQVYGIQPYLLTGGDAYNVVNDYGGTLLSKVTNSSGSGNLHAPGDILAFAASANHPTFGHTAVVTSVNVNGSGNGTVAFMQQNASADGWGSVTVTNYLLGDGITKWLHNSSGSPAPSDRDGDGVSDAQDYCISTPGPANNHGCPLNNVQVSEDMDGDGKGDVIAISRDVSDNSPYLYWFQSTSTGGSPSVADPVFLEHLSAPGWNQNNLHWLGGDFNGDGKGDLFVASCDPSTDAVVMYILLSNGTTLASPVSVKSPSPSSWKCSHLTFLTGDVSGDGKTDVIVVSRDTDNSPYIYSFNSTSSGSTPSLADATFLEHLSAPGWNVNNLKWAAGDFNADGKADLFVASGDQTTDAVVMYILLSNGTSLASPVSVKSPSVSSWKWSLLTFMAGDVSGDGKADVIAVSRDTDNSPYIYSFNSTSSGSTPSLADPAFLEHLSAPGWNVSNVKWATIDADGDGKADVFAVSGDQSTEAVVLYDLLSSGTSLASPVAVYSPSVSSWQWSQLTF